MRPLSWSGFRGLRTSGRLSCAGSADRFEQTRFVYAVPRPSGLQVSRRLRSPHRQPGAWTCAREPVEPQDDADGYACIQLGEREAAEARIQPGDAHPMLKRSASMLAIATSAQSSIRGHRVLRLSSPAHRPTSAAPPHHEHTVHLMNAPRHQRTVLPLEGAHGGRPADLGAAPPDSGAAALPQGHASCRWGCSPGSGAAPLPDASMAGRELPCESWLSWRTGQMDAPASCWASVTLPKHIPAWRRIRCSSDRSSARQRTSAQSSVRGAALLRLSSPALCQTS